MADEITLDTFFALSAPLELVNLAAQLGTQITSQADSVWQRETYGGSLEDILGRPANGLAVKIELQRALAVVGLEGDVAPTTSGDATLIRIQSAAVLIDKEGVSLDGLA